MAREPKATPATALQTDLVTAVQRRGFAVIDAVHHDGLELAPGDLAWVTEVELDGLRRAGVIDANLGWTDGEARGDSSPPQDPASQG